MPIGPRPVVYISYSWVTVKRNELLERVPDVHPPQELITRIMQQAPEKGILSGLDTARGGFKQWPQRLVVD